MRLSKLEQEQQILFEGRMRDQVCEDRYVSFVHLRETVHKKLQHLDVNVENVLRAPKLQLFVFVSGFEMVLEKAEVGHHLEVRDCLNVFLVVFPWTEQELHKDLKTRFKLL